MVRVRGQGVNRRGPAAWTRGLRQRWAGGSASATRRPGPGASLGLVDASFEVWATHPRPLPLRPDETAQGGHGRSLSRLARVECIAAVSDPGGRVIDNPLRPAGSLTHSRTPHGDMKSLGNDSATARRPSRTRSAKKIGGVPPAARRSATQCHAPWDCVGLAPPYTRGQLPPADHYAPPIGNVCSTAGRRPLHRPTARSASRPPPAPTACPSSTTRHPDRASTTAATYRWHGSPCPHPQTSVSPAFTDSPTDHPSPSHRSA